MNATEIIIIKAAKKIHRCSWCGTRITIGETYKKYRYFDGGDAGTVKIHFDCYEAMLDCDDLSDGFSPGDNPRGCNCGHSKDCEKCAILKALKPTEVKND